MMNDPTDLYLRNAILDAFAAWRAEKKASARATWLVCPGDYGGRIVLNGKLLFKWLATYTAGERKMMTCCVVRDPVHEVYLTPHRGRLVRRDEWDLRDIAAKAAGIRPHIARDTPASVLTERLGGKVIYSSGCALNVALSRGHASFVAWPEVDTAALVGGVKDKNWVALRARAGEV